MHTTSKPVILVAPLDWGLGHATRCIPVIDLLLQYQCSVIVGGTKSTNHLIAAEFPSLTYLEMPAYNVRYSKNKNWLPFKLMQQLPRLLNVIRAEQLWLKQSISTYRIQGIISDNRYGLYHASLPTIFISHQLQIQIPQSIYLQQWINKAQHQWLKKFNAVWIPDLPEQGLGGKLTQHQLPHAQFIGSLSRLKQQSTSTPQIALLCLVSGPEPQRTIFEQKILSELHDWPGRKILLRGLPTSATPIQQAGWEIYAHLESEKLASLLMAAEKIVCRAGYSTVMDLMALQKKALLVATPGQTEQVYLAEYLYQQQYCMRISPNENLNQALSQWDTFIWQPFPQPDTHLLQDAVKHWLQHFY